MRRRVVCVAMGYAAPALRGRRARPLRILDVCAFYTPHGGGVRTYIENKFRAASAMGHELVVLAPGENEAVVERAPGAYLATIRAPRFALDRRYRYFNDEPAVHRALDAWRPDIVEASSPWRSAAMVARWRGDAVKALIMHADPLSAYAYRWFGNVASIGTIDRGFDRFWRHLRRLDESFDLVVSAGDDLTSRLARGGLRKAVTIPMGVEPGLFSPERRDAALRANLLGLCGLDASGKLLIGVGRFAAEKRWPMVIDAAIAAGQDVPVGLILIGDGKLRERLQARAAGSPHIVIANPVRDRAALATIMASADALVHGCEAETFCMAVAEAKASGIPVIVPDRGGAIDHATSDNDHRFRAADPLALRNAIVAAASAPQPSLCASRPREMNAHFAELFDRYERLASQVANAAA